MPYAADALGPSLMDTAETDDVKLAKHVRSTTGSPEAAKNPASVEKARIT